MLAGRCRSSTPETRTLVSRTTRITDSRQRSTSVEPSQARQPDRLRLRAHQGEPRQSITYSPHSGGSFFPLSIHLHEPLIILDRDDCGDCKSTFFDNPSRVALSHLVHHLAQLLLGIGEFHTCFARHWHESLLASSPLPLPLLGESVQTWIEMTKRVPIKGVVLPRIC
jgi:hypothetical protein